MVEVPAGNHEVPLFIFLYQKVCQLLGLGSLAFSIVIGFQVEVYNHQFLVRSLHRNPGDQQAPLQVGCPYRPGEGHRQTLAYRIRQGVAAVSGKAGADCPDGVCHREGDESAFIIQGEAGLVVPQSLAVALPLVVVVGTPGILVHLLQKVNIRLHVLQHFGNAFLVFAYQGFTFRGALGTSVQDEIRLRTQAGIACIPGEHLQSLPLVGGGISLFQLPGRFLRLGPVLRHRQVYEKPQQQQKSQSHKGCQANSGINVPMADATRSYMDFHFHSSFSLSYHSRRQDARKKRQDFPPLLICTGKYV